jgi:hypothetical protein
MTKEALEAVRGDLPDFPSGTPAASASTRAGRGRAFAPKRALLAETMTKEALEAFLEELFIKVAG